MKRILSVFMTIVSLGVATAFLSSCNEVDQTNCEHDIRTWYTVVAPTCEEDGEEIGKCSICGKQESRIASKLNHDWQIVSDTTNCVTPGTIEYVCGNNRNHTRSEQKEALGHNWQGGIVIEAATCEKAGKCTQAFCERCGEHSQSEVIIPALGHDYIEQSREEASCEKDGSIHYVCSRDNRHVKDETIRAMGHEWDVGSVIKEATCTTPGVAISGKCRRCGITKGVVEIPQLGHDMQLQSIEPLPGSDADQNICGGAGIEIWKCTRCDETETRTVPGISHTYPSSGWFIRRSATCQQEGEKFRKCSVCGYEDRMVTPKIPHNFSRIVYTVQPTCEQPGRMKKQCSMCSAYQSETEEFAPATGHDWKELGVSDLPTCRTEGHATHRCLTCNKLEEYTLDTIGHVYGDYVIDSENQMSKHCVFCEQKSDIRPIPQPENDKVQYELRLRRTNGMPFSPHARGTGFENLEYQIFDDTTLIKTIKVDKDILTVSIPTSAKKLKVDGLPEGFTSVQNEYELDSTKPLVTIEVQARIISDFATENQQFAKVPKKPLFIGDVMHDFWVEDIRNPGNSQKFSELIEGKKFVFMDFFHINCSWCTTYTKRFLNTYARDMYRYHDEMLVILVDIQDDGEYGIKNYCNQYNIPEEFVVCKSKDYVEGIEKGRGILSWFETEKGYLVATPGHVWLDSEGVIYDMKVYTTEDAVRDMINGYFEKLYVGEAKHRYSEKQTHVIQDVQTPVSLENLCLSRQTVIDEKRKCS